MGTDASYAPSEFLAADGKTVQGFDVDLFKAVGQKFGVDVEFVSSNFDSIITGVTTGKYDVGVSSFTINDKRKQQATMVSYYQAGTQWATQKGNPNKVDPNNPLRADRGRADRHHAGRRRPAEAAGRVQEGGQAGHQGQVLHGPGRGHRRRRLQAGRRDAGRLPRRRRTR